MSVSAVYVEGLITLVDLFVCWVEHQAVGTILGSGDSIVTHVELVTLRLVRVLVRLVVGTLVLTICEQSISLQHFTTFMKTTLRRGDLILSYEVLVKLHFVIILVGHFVCILKVTTYQEIPTKLSEWWSWNRVDSTVRCCNFSAPLKVQVTLTLALALVVLMIGALIMTIYQRNMI